MLKFPSRERHHAADQMFRRFFAAGAVLAAIGGVAIVLEDFPITAGVRTTLSAAHWFVAALCLWGWRRKGALHGAAAAVTAAWTAAALCTLTAALLGHGNLSLNLSFFTVLVCAMTALVSARAGATLALGCVVVVASFAALESAGWLVTRQALVQAPVAHGLLTQLLLIGAGFAAGAVVLKLANTSRRVERERSRHLASVLAIAADHYWETDDLLRLTRFEHLVENDTDAALKVVLTTHLDEPVSGLYFAPDILAKLSQAMMAHRRFHKFPCQAHTGETHSSRQLALSGHPRHDEHGRFRGYWGVAHDITREVMAEQARRGSEQRYAELFRMSPSAMLLHRDGAVVELNQAAAQLLGHTDPASLLGGRLVDLAVDEAMALRLRDRLCLLESLPAGQSLPSAEIQLRHHDGTALHLRARCMRVEAEHGAASLTMLIDDTAAKRAETALRRSELTLNSIFASSPECISLSVAATGRYAMVNPAWCRLFGWSPQEAIGRNSDDLQLWGATGERERLATALQASGRIDGIHIRRRTRSGKAVTMLLSAAHCTLDGEQYLVTNARDITAEERARQEHGAILQNAPIGVAFSRERCFASANPMFEQMFGRPAGSLVGQPDDVLWDACRDERQGIVSQVERLRVDQGSTSFERMLERPDGSHFWCRVRVQALVDGTSDQPGLIWIAEDLSVQHRNEQALAAARDAAEAASRAKSAFLANTSHEIRTPLNGLVGLTRLAAQPALDAHKRDTYLTQILELAQSLSGLISDILDLSKIEAGRLELAEQAFHLGDLLRLTFQGYRVLADEKGLQLTLELGDGLPNGVLGDPLRLRQVIGNLLSNAIKFTHHGGVRLHAEMLPSGLMRLAVHDSGIGIDKTTLQRLFTPFTQADASTTRRFGGSGLGLSICRQLAEMMGGSVGVSSRPGQGSCFWLDLPLRPAPQPVSSHPTAGNAERREHVAGMRVLVAEDNAVNQLIAAALLEQWHISVGTANDGAEAVAAVHRAHDEGEPYDAVLMDMQMPKVDGVAATQELRRTFSATALPIIALTAGALVGERERALAAGMNDFITKPIEPQRLRGSLARWRLPAHSTD